ncbi:MAG: alpha/beta fold hydrolase [Gemmatimonadales bacterium]|nr:alpha/beta fold hydrolase [Candidatus Palauibacter irciniicola]MYC19350.1 alpha/beta fold hydrolase [Gemmatimonadales bacterium]
MAGCDAPASEAGPPTRAGSLSVFEAELFYQTVGAGEPVVVVHGGPGLDHSYLRPWFGPLAETHQVVFYDQRGLGASRAVVNAASLSMERYLTDIDRIREHVAQREKITLLAHSWGAIPALLYAMERPERLAALILVAPVEPGSRFREQTDENQLARRDSADLAAIDSIRGTPEFAAREAGALSQVFFHVFRGTFADAGVADSLLRLSLHERTASQGQLVASLLMAPLQGLDFWDRLGAIEVPVLIVHGAQDPIPIEMVQAMNDALPDSRLIRVDGSGHFPFIEQPMLFWTGVHAFLQQRPREGP